MADEFYLVIIRTVVHKLFWFADHLKSFGGPQTTSANLADHQWSAEQTLGFTALGGETFEM
jgi:hypothetical protein